MDFLAAQVELRGEQARLAERARIAAEMHDVLAHRLSPVALHSGVLTMRADTLPPQVADRLPQPAHRVRWQKRFATPVRELTYRSFGL